MLNLAENIQILLWNVFISTKLTGRNSCSSCRPQVIWYTNQRCGVSVDSAGSSSHAEPAPNATRKRLMSAVPPICSWPAQLISATSQCPGLGGYFPPMASQLSGLFLTLMTTWSWRWSLRRTRAKLLPTSQPSHWKDESCCLRLRSETWNMKGWSSSSLEEESGISHMGVTGWPCVHQCNVVDIKCHKWISLRSFDISVWECSGDTIHCMYLCFPLATCQWKHPSWRGRPMTSNKTQSTAMQQATWIAHRTCMLAV